MPVAREYSPAYSPDIAYSQYGLMIKEQLSRFNRLDLLSHPTPLEKLDRLSAWLGRDIYVKRDDLTPLALGGNKLRKLEYLAADALAQGADTLVTAGAIQSNHVRQTAALAAKLGLGCVALLENPIGTEDSNYLGNGNRLLLELFDVKVELVENLDNVDEQLQALAGRLRSNGKKPYLVPIGGSNALGALGYVRAGLELAEQIKDTGLEFAAVVLASGSAGTHGGLALALSETLPDLPVIGVTVSRSEEDQFPKVQGLAERTAQLLEMALPPAFKVNLWDEYFAPRYGEPNAGTLAAVKLLASQEGLLLDPVYTGKAMAGLLDGIGRDRFENGPIIFLHTGGAPALFAYDSMFQAQ
jgi:D-cysteine desulfhydrase